MTHSKVIALAQDIRRTAQELGYGVDDLLSDLACELHIPIPFPTVQHDQDS